MSDITIAIMAVLSIVTAYFKISSNIKQSKIDALSQENNILKENVKASTKKMLIQEKRAGLHRETAKKILQNKISSSKEIKKAIQEIEHAQKEQSITLSL